MNKKILLMALSLIVLFLNPTYSFWEENVTNSGAVVTESWASTPIYSLDSKHFTYSMVKKDKTVIIVDGKELKTQFDEIDSSFFWVLDNGSVYVKAKIKATNKWFYIIWSFKSDIYDEVNIQLYGTNYQIVSWSARKGTSWYIIHNNKVAWPYQEYSDSYPSYSEDYSKFIFRVTKNKKGVLVINGKELKLWYNVDSFYLSPNGKKIALIIIDSDWEKFVMLGNKKFKKYTDIYSLQFSPDSSQLIYIWLWKDGKNTLVIDGNDRETYDSIGYIAFSRSWKHRYYMVTNWEKQFMILDWVEQKKYDEVQYIYYSDDEKYTAYYAKEWEKWVLVVNGREVQP